jgi:hypothetical protein
VTRPVAGWPEAIAAVPYRHPEVKLIIGRSPDAPVVSLALIRTLGEPGTGLADAALSDLCATADEYQVTVTSTPVPLGPDTSQARLVGWYASHGFEWTDLPGTMRRRPRR